MAIEIWREFSFEITELHYFSFSISFFQCFTVECSCIIPLITFFCNYWVLDAILNNSICYNQRSTINLNIDHLQANESTKRNQWMGKINFVETRSYWHIFRSFDRMWSFFILCLQVSLSFSFISRCFLLFLISCTTCWASSVTDLLCVTEGDDHYCMEWIWPTRFYFWRWCVQESVEHFHNSCHTEACSRWRFIFGKDRLDIVHCPFCYS